MHEIGSNPSRYGGAERPQLCAPDGYTALTQTLDGVSTEVGDVLPFAIIVEKSANTGSGRYDAILYAWDGNAIHELNQQVAARRVRGTW